MSDWNSIRFADFADINPHVDINKSIEYPFVEMADIIPGRRYVRANQSRKFSSGSRFEDGDILFARITPCLENGKIAQFRSGAGKTGIGSTEFIVLRKREGISDSSFIFYLASSDFIRKPAEKSMVGASGRQRADLSVIENIEIEVPSLNLQHKIASILSAYDALIENNTRRIKILEEMAQSIYCEWFVNFRFPDHEKVRMVDSKLGKIPEGWQVDAIGNRIETYGGGTPSTKIPEYWEPAEVTWFIPSDLTKTNATFVFDSEKKISGLGLTKSAAKLFPSYSVMMTSRATIGATAINTIQACTNQGFITCIPNEAVSNYQIYFWIKENLRIIDSIASGATYKEISRSEFRELLITIADKNVRKLFVDTVYPIFKQIENLLLKNINLRQTREHTPPPPDFRRA